MHIGSSIATPQFGAAGCDLSSHRLPSFELLARPLSAKNYRVVDTEKPTSSPTRFLGYYSFKRNVTCMVHNYISRHTYCVFKPRNRIWFFLDEQT